MNLIASSHSDFLSLIDQIRVFDTRIQRLDSLQGNAVFFGNPGKRISG